MFAEHRHQLIIQRLARDGMVRVSDLVDECGVNAMTIRRDLASLADAGRLHRVHGGAVAVRRPGTRQLPRIGLMVPNTDSYYGAVVRGAERAARHFGGQLVLATHFQMAELERDRLERLIHLNLDALILTPGTRRTWTPDPPEPRMSPETTLVSDETIQSLISGLQCPVILLEREFPLGTGARSPSVVRSAHDRGAFLAIEHFHSLGHRSVLVALRSTATVPGIVAGVTHAAKVLDMEIDLCVPRTPEEFSALVDACAQRKYHGLLLHPEDLTRRLLTALRERDVRTPRDVHVIAYDDIQASKQAVPLSAISPAKDELGYEAVRMALRQTGRSPGRTVQRLILDPCLVIRQSTRPNTADQSHTDQGRLK